MKVVFAASLLPLSTAFVVPKKQRAVYQHAISPKLQTRVVSDPLGIMSENLRNTSATDEVDLGKAIFLANSEENAELLGVIEQASAMDFAKAAKLSDATHLTDAIISSQSIEETVNAILVASEVAAAVAEATLLSDIANDVSVTKTVPSQEVITVDDTIQAPSVSKILKFAIPAIGVWLCSPLLSLIDTSAVGILSGTVQQAALNPAVAVTDYAALLIAFMYTGTTNLIAAAKVKDHGDTAAPRTSGTLIGVLQLSTFVGAALGAVLFVFARTLLRTLIGNDGISPAVFDAAMKYVQIRSLGMPAAAMIGSAQAACLGMQDIKSPLYVLCAAAAVNFLGDVLFVGSSHPLIGGAAGAAWATVISQYAAAGMFMHWLCNKASKKEVDDGTSKTMNLSNAILELTGKPSSDNESRRRRFVDAVKSLGTQTLETAESHFTAGATKGKAGILSSFFLRRSKNKRESSEEKAFSARGFLEGKLRKRDLVNLPTRKTLDDFAPYVIPVTSTMVGRLSGYIAMSHVVSSSLGTISMAAQQVIVSLFYCLTPIADSLSLTAQSFLPSLSEREASHDRSRALRQTAKNFMKAGGVFGAVMVAAVSCVPLLSGFFTSDPHVISLVNMVAPLLMGIFAVHGFVCSSEGLLLGQKDLGFLGKMYAGFFAVVPYFMLRVKRAALSDTSGKVNLPSVWKVFLAYQLFRSVVWSSRLAIIQRRIEQEAPATP